MAEAELSQVESQPYYPPDLEILSVEDLMILDFSVLHEGIEEIIDKHRQHHLNVINNGADANAKRHSSAILQSLDMYYYHLEARRYGMAVYAVNQHCLDNDLPVVLEIYADRAGSELGK
ncbi:MAG: hypothetical protein ABII01_03890 [Candidatus Woesearchaeota archaeon]